MGGYPGYRRCYGGSRGVPPLALDHCLGGMGGYPPYHDHDHRNHPIHGTSMVIAIPYCGSSSLGRWGSTMHHRRCIIVAIIAGRRCKHQRASLASSLVDDASINALRLPYRWSTMQASTRFACPSSPIVACTAYLRRWYVGASKRPTRSRAPTGIVVASSGRGASIAHASCSEHVHARPKHRLDQHATDGPPGHRSMPDRCDGSYVRVVSPFAPWRLEGASSPVP